MKINIYGNAFGTSGYACHVRGLAKGLKEAGFTVGVETPLFNGWEAKCPTWLREMIDTDCKQETTICIAPSPAWAYKLSDRPKKFYGFLVFEGDKVPQQWADICLNDKRIDGVFVPSEHTRKALLRTLLKPAKESGFLSDDEIEEQIKYKEFAKWIHTVPHGYDPEVYNKEVPVPEDLKSDKFTFLWVGGWSKGEEDRKNLPDTLRAFCKAFGPEDNVRLIVKINTAYSDQAYVMEAVEQLGLPPVDTRPDIQFIASELTEKQMAGLYSAADWVISFSRAEAFNIPLLEANACGTPVIYTGFGGQKDFAKGMEVLEGYMKPASDPEPMYRGVLWEYPRIKNMVDSLVLAKDQHFSKEKWLNGIHADGWTWKDSGLKVKAVLESIK